jgi:hypothetical protein
MKYRCFNRNKSNNPKQIYYFILLINVIVAFSDNFSNCSKNEDIDTFGIRMIILKRIKSIRQLRRSEKELVRLCYKEAIIKGFTLKGIQQHIASKQRYGLIGPV